ncbi:MAG: TetR family transcriptional regulator [bacterium]
MSTGLPETRQSILDATWKLVADSRTASFSLSDVAKAAGVSRQAVYLHFGSRAGLLLALAQFVEDKLDIDGKLDATIEASSPLSRARRFISLTTRFAGETHEVALVLERERDRDPEVAAAFEERTQRRLALLQDIFFHLELDGMLSPLWTVDQAADAIWAFGSPTVYELLVVARKWPPAEFERYVLATFNMMLVD